MKRWSPLLLFIIFSAQFFLVGCYMGQHGFPSPTLGLDRTTEELHECLTNYHKSYTYWRTRDEFKYYTEDWDAGGKWISPITFPVWLFFAGIPNGLYETVWFPVDASRERGYQSRCVEWKVAADARDRVIDKEIQVERLRKGLPDSADLTPGNLDRAAASLARDISLADEQSLTALLRALQIAGLSIIDENRTVLQKPSDGDIGQGLGFYDFEAEGSLRLQARGVSISLEKLAGTIIKEVPHMTASQFAELLLTNLRTQANNSTNTYLRFWARLIIELSNHSVQPVDLMAAPVSHVNLSVLQASLLIRRLQGDIAVLKKKYSQATAIHPLFSQQHSSIPALWNMDDVPVVHLVDNPSKDPLPCSQTGDEALILDAAANALSFGNDQLMDLLKEAYKDKDELKPYKDKVKPLDKLSKGLMYVNWILGWGKLVAAVTALKGEIAVDNLPLIRTKTSEPGERRLMTAKIWSEVGKKQMVNCYRTAANIATGLDFNLPSDGPVADTAVGWNFASREEAKFVRFEAPKDKHRNPSTQITDSKGISQMWLVGASKIPAVVYLKNPKQVTKTANLWVYVTLKSSKDFVQNWIDIGGSFLGGLNAVPGSIAEIGFRLPYVAARAAVPVIDHEPVSGYKVKRDGLWLSPGVICSFEKPFTLTSIDGLNVTYTFVPSSPTSGQWTGRGYFKAAAYAHIENGGSYTIVGADTHTPIILTRAEGKASVTIPTREGPLTFSDVLNPHARELTMLEASAHVELVPLDTEECTEP